MPRPRRSSIAPQNYSLNKRLPAYLYKRTRALKPRLWECAYAIMAHLWPRWDGAALPVDALLGRVFHFPHNTATATLADLQYLGLIEPLAAACSIPGKAHGAVYNIPLEMRRAAYADDGGHYASMNDARSGARHRQRVDVHPQRLGEILKGLTFTWDGAAAWERLMQMDPAARRKAWKAISRYASGRGLKPSWRVCSVGRVVARRPDVQNIPRVFRIAEVLSPGHDLYEVDFKGQHAGIVRTLKGLEPLAAPWASLSEASGVDAATCKEIVNAYYGGQTPNTWAWHERKEGRHGDAGTYAAVMAAAASLALEWDAAEIKAALDGIPAADVLQVIGAEIQAATLESIGDDLPPMLLPLHDGYVIAGTHADARRLADAMADASDAVLGIPLSLEIEKIKV